MSYKIRTNRFSIRKLFWAALSAPIFCVAVQANDGWDVDTELPDLTSFNLSGELPGTKGNVVLVDFWASWCAPCKASFPSMEEAYQKYKDKGFKIVAVSVDSKAKSMESFVNRLKPSFSIVHDSEQRLVAAAGIEVMPTSFLVDKSGKIRFVHLGWHGKESAERLMAEVEQLLGEEPS